MTKILFWANNVSLFYIFILPIIFICFFGWNTHEIFSFFFLSVFSKITSNILGLLSLSFWLYCVNFWNKYDKRLMNLILLFFLNALYTPFYFLKIISKSYN